MNGRAHHGSAPFQVQAPSHGLVDLGLAQGRIRKSEAHGMSALLELEEAVLSRAQRDPAGAPRRSAERPLPSPGRQSVEIRASGARAPELEHLRTSARFELESLV